MPEHFWTSSPPDRLVDEMVIATSNKIDSMITTLGALQDALFRMEGRYEQLKTYVEDQFNNMDLKKIKRNRTHRNRCQYFNHKKDRTCSGFVCKDSKSKTLCYAHHLLAKNPEDRQNLFGGKRSKATTLSELEPPILELLASGTVKRSTGSS
jgi:hypothetical protein